jgi:ketosteroid isomerase-like protein
MKRIVFSLACILISLSTAGAQRVDRAAALKEAVETERAFAKTSELKGIRDSFLAFIAEDGILFRPSAVNGKKYLLDHPEPASTKRPLLSWQPSFAEVASSGEMAYTTGPWQFRQDIKDEKPVAFGHFMTVWKKQSDGTWKFAIDLGVSHPQPTSAPETWEPKAYEAEAKPSNSSSSAGEKERQILLDVDGKFSLTSEREGADKALLSFAAKEIRLFRNKKMPFIGLENARQGAPPPNSNWSWKPAFSDVSKANDLGYTYGSYEIRNESKTLAEKGNYLRIWKKQGELWRVVVDVADPLPLEEKKS